MLDYQRKDSIFFCFFFFFNDTATTEIYTLSLHDALPISAAFLYASRNACDCPNSTSTDLSLFRIGRSSASTDRKSTRLNSSHSQISYAVFCLKKKKKILHKRRQLPTMIHSSARPLMPAAI